MEVNFKKQLIIKLDKLVKISLVIIIKDFFNDFYIVKENDSYKFYILKRKTTKKKTKLKKVELEVSLELLGEKNRK